MILSRDFTYFKAAYLEGSFRGAAEAIAVSPSSVNRLVIRLEERLGLQLFRRTPGGLIPTQAAERLFELLCRTTEDFNEFLEDHAPDGRGENQGVTIAATPSLVREVVVPGLRASSEKPCERALNLSVKARPDLSDCFQGTVCDADIVVGFDLDLTVTSSMEILFERELSVGAVMRPDHPLASCRPLHLKDCVAHSFILPDETWPLHQHLEREIESAKGTTAKAASSNAIEYLRDEVLNGGKIGFQTLIGMVADIETGSLLYRPLRVERPCIRSADSAGERQELLLMQRVGVASRRGRRSEVQAAAIEKLSTRISDLARLDMMLRGGARDCVALPASPVSPLCLPG